MLYLVELDKNLLRQKKCVIERFVQRDYTPTLKLRDKRNYYYLVV